jgi:hypothetical protein
MSKRPLRTAGIGLGIVNHAGDAPKEHARLPITCRHGRFSA